MANNVSQPMAMIVFLAVVVVAGGCNRAIQTDSGSKSLERSKAAVGDLASSPALSARAGDTQPEEMVIARVDASGQQIEDLRQEQFTRSAAGLQDVFFEFDRWTITESGRRSLGMNADWLRANPAKKVSIEGHCDERGTLAYNMVLGEKRATSIRAYLIDLGIKAERLEVVSYGKERPICQERTEACYQQNRRGHLAIRIR